jgi:hypothetical protein
MYHRDGRPLLAHRDRTPTAAAFASPQTNRRCFPDSSRAPQVAATYSTAE